ncbi:MAG: ATP synthase subunit delta [Parcubacteria group bacterium GW2011_GWC2_45_7]|nr:MAG: ATP synthase subunit delta [Parcubacteria group bacterium GW2011_GWC2_45_7]KKU73723.1 MAG: ATP synthase subunit delta [Parcubacteria group bacterium GW2011_GWA2_47_26]
MKVTSKQYAVLLYELTHEAKKAELKEIGQSFLRLLIKGRALHLLPRILKLYENYYNACAGITDVEIVTAQEMSRKAVQTIKKTVEGKVELRQRVDQAVIGGALIKINDWMIDNTLKTRINKLRQKLYGR